MISINYPLFSYQTIKVAMLIILYYLNPILGSSENFLLQSEESILNLHAEYTPGNMTHKEIANFLRSKNFIVQEFPNQPPIVFIGDMAYSADEIFARTLGGRHSNVVTNNLWVENGKAEAWYYYDTGSNADKKIFEDAVKTWGDKTCITFTKTSDGACNKKVSHGEICVGNFGGCWSKVGNIYRFTKQAQQMSVQPDGCEVVAAAHEFGHALGFYHQQSRPDRDEYMAVRHEHFEVKMEDRHNERLQKKNSCQGGRCNADQTQDFPLPFDFMSLMMYRTTSFGDDDARSIFTAKDGHYQYIIDYHRPAGLTQSHYDLYLANKVYGCEKIWKDKCAKNGKTFGKCANLGYVGKDCKCKCPETFSGPTCATKGKTMYPVRPKAKVVDVTEPTLIDLTKFKFSTKKEDGILESFNVYQYFTVVVKGNDLMLSVMDMIQDSNVASFLNTYGSDTVLQAITLDCRQFTQTFWGVADKFQIRTECFSSLHNYERIGPHFRSWSNMLDFFYLNNAGSYFGKDPTAATQLMTFKLNVTFHRNPAKILVVKGSPSEKGKPPTGGGSSSGGAGGGGEASGAGEGGEASRAAAGGGGPVLSTPVIAAAGGGLALLILGIVLTCLCRKRRDEYESDEDTDSDTESSD